MGRKRKNEFEESSIRFESGMEFQLNHVKVPFWVNITYKEKIGEYNDGKSIYGTTTIMNKRDISEKYEIIKELQKDGYREVLNVEEYTIRFSDLCPNCNRKGIPKVERKSNIIDYHTRAETGSHNNPTNRPDEYWLCYDHKEKPYKWRVAKWDKDRFTFIKYNKVYNKLRKYIFPHYIGWKQGELDDFDSFRKFFNTVHA